MSSTDTTAPGAPEPDFDHLLRANLERVFNERNPVRCVAALEPVMYEPTGIVVGRDAISEVAGRLLKQIGPTFAFSAEGEVVGHHGLGYLRWRAVRKAARVQ